LQPKFLIWLEQSVVLKLGSIKPLGFDGAVSEVRRRSSKICNPFLLYVILDKNDKSLEIYARVQHSRYII